MLKLFSWNAFSAQPANGFPHLTAGEDLSWVERRPNQSFLRRLKSRRFARLGAALAVGFLFAWSSHAEAAAVYYSVGTTVADLKTAGTQITIAAGVATFDRSQPNNVGVGDAILYGATTSYISGRTSSTQYSVITRLGATPANVPVAVAVTSIRRAFNLLSDAETQSTNGTHLATANLVAGNYQLNWPCYNDGPMNNQVLISGYTTGANNYIRVYTPVHANEVGASQRHTGRARTGFRLQPTSAIDNDTIHVLDAFVRIEGIEIDGSLSTAPNGAGGVWLQTIALSPVDHYVSHNIIYETRNFTGIAAASVSAKVWNNVLHRVNNLTLGALSMDEPSGTGYFYNNTVYDCAGKGINENAGTMIAINNASLNNGGAGAFPDFSGGTQSYNVSSDATATGTGSQINKTSYATYFVNTTAGIEDLRLRNTSLTLWGSNGADLSANANQAVTDDIQGSARVRPDIGADEFGPGPGPQMLVLSGAYTGSGVDNRAIFVGFPPDVVIVDMDEAVDAAPNAAVIRTSVMVGDVSKDIDDPNAVAGNKVQSLDASGFTIGTDATVNEAGRAYHWVAFRAAPGMLKVGSYPGVGVTDNRSITGVGFRPDYVIVLPESTARAVHRSSAMPGDVTYQFSTANFPDGIQALESDGFQLGLDPRVNAAATSYYYAAWTATPGKVAVGVYTGNGVDSRNITGTGFLPEDVIVNRSNGSFRTTHKPASTGVAVDRSLLFENRIGEADNIQALQADGFQVGINSRVNTAPNDYYWMAFGPHAPRVNHRSIGNTAVTYGTAGTTGAGTRVSVTNGSATVGGLLGTTWRAANRGRGDVITIPCDNPPTCTMPSPGVHYMILGVASDSSLQLSQGYQGADNASASYLIRRQLSTFAAWEDCVDGPPGTACPYFPVTSASLVTDDRREVGIAYKDSVFTPAAQVLFVGATTDTLHTITLTADGTNRHNGVQGAGVVIDGLGANRGFRIEDSNYTVEWLEFRNIYGVTDEASILIRGGTGSQTGVLLQNLLIHDFFDGTANVIKGIGVQGNGGKVATIRNTLIWNGDFKGIEGDDVTDVITIENCTVDGMANYGIDAFHSQFIVRNSISTRNPSGDFVRLQPDGSLTGSNNTSSDLTAAGPPAVFANPQTSAAASALYVDFTGPVLDLHLQPTAVAVDTGLDLLSSFFIDIDGALRPVGLGWDRGADEFGATTEVTLVSFTATGRDGAVELSWATASELNNLGFHLYRSDAPDGPYTRITSSLIPGLGSSPTGQSYSYRDAALVNGQTYYYELEDVETTGKTELHGPVWATPLAGAGTGSGSGGSGGSGDGDSGSGSSARITYGRPEERLFRVLERGASHVLLELVTPGFYAMPKEDGTVDLEIPGFESRSVPGAPAVPVLQTYVEAVAGRRVRLRSAVASEQVRFDGLRVAMAEAPAMVVTETGTVVAGRVKRQAAVRRGLFPRSWSQLLGTSFQGETKKARVELSPLRYDLGTGTTVLAGRLLVRLEFEGVERGERGLGGSRGRRPRPSPLVKRNGLVAELVTKEAGLYAVRFEDVLGGGRGVPSSSLRLSYQGQGVAYHLEPPRALFAPGSVLYFVSEGAASNPWGDAVYALETGRAGVRMATVNGSPSGPATLEYLDSKEWEENRFYQAGLLEAPDLWQWDLLVSPVTKSYPFTVSQLSSSSTAAHLWVWLQGASDFEADPDHHLRVLVNGTPVGEASWDAKTERVIEAEILPGILQEGANTLSLESVGDTSAAYSMVFLNRFSLRYPRLLVAENGQVQGSFGESGTAEVSGLDAPAFVLDAQEQPKWLQGLLPIPGGVSFRAEGGRSYLAVASSAVKTPTVRRPVGSRLRSSSNRADWVLIGPKEFLSTAQPLVALRRSQGLEVKVVSVEEISQEFGYGESRPEAVKGFLEYAYASWRRPSLRYVVLLGDGTYDPKDYLKTGVKDRIPPYIVKTSYLWTASDPAYGAVNGEDLLPDVAVGRMSAGTSEEARILVEKVVAFETEGRSLDGKGVLIADNADLGGSFEADADEIAAGVLSQREVEKVYLRDLQGGTRATIVAAFDNGPGLVSYMGHGGTAVWASENVFNNTDVASLSSQGQQPLLLTLNCLNGFFHFPPLNSLAEAFLKAEGKGAVAAFSPSGLSLNDAAHVYHMAVLAEIESGRHARLGDAILAAQSFYADSGAFPELLSIYHLLGDPALRIR